MDGHHLAELNIGRLGMPLDDPRVAPFVSALDAVNALADRSPGFVWRLVGADMTSPGATRLPMPADEQSLVNMSVWEDGDALRHYVFNTVHRKVYERRHEWFEIMVEHHFVMWWVPAGSIPTLEDAAARLMDLRDNGPSDRAFGWAQLPNAQAWTKRQCA